MPKIQILQRIQVSTDWKGRPSVHVTVLAQNLGRAEFLKLIDADIQALQEEDLRSDNQDREPGTPEVTEWADSQRWEMNYDEMLKHDPMALRCLAGLSEGDSWSTSYEILEVDPSFKGQLLELV